MEGVIPCGREGVNVELEGLINDTTAMYSSLATYILPVNAHCIQWKKILRFVRASMGKQQFMTP